MYFSRGLRFLQEGSLITFARKKNLSLPFFRTKTVLLHRLPTISLQIRLYKTYDSGPHENGAKNEYTRTQVNLDKSNDGRSLFGERIRGSSLVLCIRPFLQTGHQRISCPVIRLISCCAVSLVLHFFSRSSMVSGTNCKARLRLVVGL